MKNKFVISVFVVSFISLSVHSQPANKKADTVTPAKQVIGNNNSEKDLPRQLKENQLKGEPVTLKADSLGKSVATNGKKKKSCDKSKRKKHG